MSGEDDDKAGGGEGGKPAGAGGGPKGAEAIAEIGAVFKGLGGFVEMLGALVEKAETVERQGSFTVKGAGDEAQGVYGFSVRTGLGGVPRVRSFGNVRPTARGPVVDDVREPLVDLFDEADGVIVTAEIPGVAEDEIALSIEDGKLSITTSGRHRYAKTIALPAGVDPASLERSHRNGILQVKLRKV
ncbi:archaeal heat shock protein Hsp20 [Prosthecomicrobium pneumaticum]|uniref:HSP20 family protein n=1 Tax=Prosthecomicrobium pneumaticum TaxID=81895 RepID=A0A7W9FJ53_9HYPH|nr:archaeal heat shock protein Hsp20 [Prosthecomicrobium pneumaticum]MBB5751377.1 HSP20 family protein [Prosthecomicrobium pneumaticum]